MEAKNIIIIKIHTQLAACAHYSTLLEVPFSKSCVCVDQRMG
jgi:hypothetical protein